MKKFFCFFLLLFISNHLFPVFNFSSRNSRVRLVNPASKLLLNTPMTDFDGTLEVVDNNADRIQGQGISFDDGILDSGDIRIQISGFYDPTSTDSIVLAGGHRICADAGTILPDVLISGTDNSIEGIPRFSNDITISNSSSELKIGIQNKLNQDIAMNGGAISLLDSLHLDDDVLLTGSGTINFNGKTLHFPGQDSSWTSSLFLNVAGDIELHAKTDVKGTWTFGGDAPGVMNGNGNTLDLTNGGTLWVKSGCGVALVDVVLKGLGSGHIVFEDANSTFTLSNTTIVLDSDYSVTQGSFYAKGDNCKVITGDKLLTFEQKGTFSVDAVSIFYDHLASPDINNIRPYEDDGTHLILLNGGRILTTAGGGIGGDLILDAASNFLTTNEHFDGTSRILQFRGDISSDMVLDGRGLFIYCASSGTPLIHVNDGKNAVLKNIVLKDFEPGHVQLGVGSTLIFGDHVKIELPENIDLNTTWSFVGGVSTIDGRGSRVSLNYQPAIMVDHGTTLVLHNVGISGLAGAGDDDYITSSNNLRCLGHDSVICAHDVKFVLSSDFTFTCGNIDVQDEVHIEGRGSKFIYSSPDDLTITSNSTLFLERGLTFSYESTSTTAPKERIVFQESSSRLYLDGCTFHATTTGVKFQKGTLVVDDLVNLESEATSTMDAIVLDSGLSIEILGSATLSMDGYLTYE